MNHIDLLRAIAARTDNEHVAALSAAEQEFAMTLEGRRLLECIMIGGSEFRLSASARQVLAASGTNQHPPNDADQEPREAPSA